jgi:glycosyltransferase involved in cell wall biosynthesis
MSKKRILLDGWPLIYEPNSPAAIHLHTLVNYFPAEFVAILALPANIELDTDLEGIEQIVIESHDLGKWQQRFLQNGARDSGSGMIHSTMPGASLFGRLPVLLSPSGALQADQYASRLAMAQSEGGMQRAHFLWADDLRQEPRQDNVFFSNPVVHPDFLQRDEIELPSFMPETYVLAHGPFAEDDLRDLLEAWTWAAASIGENYPLTMLGIDGDEAAAIKEMLPDYHLDEYVQLLPNLAWSELVAVYRNSSAVLLMRDGYFWGASARLALAAGRTLVGKANAQLDRLVGPAAYLVDEGDLRSLGAAMIGSVVDERIWERLEEAATLRSAGWNGKGFSEKLAEIYGEIS